MENSSGGDLQLVHAGRIVGVLWIYPVVRRSRVNGNGAWCVDRTSWSILTGTGAVSCRMLGLRVSCSLGGFRRKRNTRSMILGQSHSRRRTCAIRISCIHCSSRLGACRPLCAIILIMQLQRRRRILEAALCHGCWTRRCPIDALSLG